MSRRGFTPLNPKGTNFKVGNLTGFTTIELVVVIVIIGIIATITLVMLSSLRAKSRDTQRISDISEIQAALERYRVDQGFFPSVITPGQALVGPATGKTYLATIPTNPHPIDGSCTLSEYIYEVGDDPALYYLTYCLGSAINDVAAGNETAVPSKIAGGTRPIFTYGNGSDGDVTIVSGSKNINTDTIASGRTCADGINYTVTGLTSTTATLSTTPAAGCLAAGDMVLLINLRGASTSYANVGNYEPLMISSINSNVITFTAAKTNNYGNDGGDTNLGSTDSDAQMVMLQRVPQYNNLTIDSGATLTASGWNVKGGVIAMKVKGTMTINGTVSANALGYPGGATYAAGCGQVGYQGQTYWYKAATRSVSPNYKDFGGSTYVGGGGGGGGYHDTYTCLGAGGGVMGYGTSGCDPGANDLCFGASVMYGGYGGCGYGVTNTTKLYMGSGGGSGGTYSGGGCVTVPAGGYGGGIIYLIAKTLTVGSTGYITSNGGSASAVSPSNDNTGGSGGGSGGTIYISSNSYPTGLYRSTINGGTGTTSGTTHIGWNGTLGRLFVSPDCSSSCTDLPGLVAYWNFNSSLTSDLGAGSYTLTNVSTVANSTCLFSNCADFGNTATKRALYVANNFKIGVAKPITVAFWIKLQSDVSAGDAYTSFYLFQHQIYYGSMTQGVFYDYNGGTKRLGFMRYSDTTGGGSDIYYYNTTLGTASSHFIVYTYDGATIKGYLDGSPVASGASTMRPVKYQTYPDRFIIGNSGIAEPFRNSKYYIDHVQVYNRALSATEISTLYTGQSGM